MNHKTLSTIKVFDMINQGDRVFVALSGGADSVALLHVLRGLQKELGITLHALHLNHRLRGGESRRDEKFVRGLCRSWGIPLTVETLPVATLAKQHGLSVEDCARRLRYGFFRRHAAEPGDKVATAHTASDNVETVLFNLARGTALRGLCGIPPVRGNIVRPLLHCSRREVEGYCRRYRLRYVTDSTNLSDDYSRNKIRHQVVPVLAELNPALEDSVSRMTGALRADADFLDRQMEKCWSVLYSHGGIRREAFLRLPAVFRVRILKKLLVTYKLRYDQNRMELLEEQIRRGSGAVQLSDRWLLKCSGERFWLEKPGKKRHRRPPVSREELPVALPTAGNMVEATLFPGKTMRFFAVELQNYKNSLNNERKLLKNALDCDRIEKILNLRRARPGDVLRPVGRNCTKTMKKIWSENKLPLGKRRERLVLTGSQGVVWAEDTGPDEAFAAGEDTALALLVNIIEE